MRQPRAWFVLGLLATASACGESSSARDEREWRAAERAFADGDESVYERWAELDTHMHFGQLAHERLAAADQHYRRAIALYRDNQPGVREAMQAGLALAPIHPEHYLTLARLCAERGNAVRAADLYRKYMGHAPPDQAAVAGAELARLTGGNDPFPPSFIEGRATRAAPGPRRLAPWMLTGLLAPVGIVALWHLRRRGRRLRTLLAQRPEWHPTAAYHLGCLRHEFFKHRIGPAGDPLRALLAGKASPHETQFLYDRLFQSGSLLQGWRAQLGALERSLGLAWKLDACDPMFRRARSALRGFGAGPWPPGPRRVRRMLAAHAALMAFEHQLSDLVAGLVRCHVDDALLAEVLDSTRSEWATSQVALDDVRLGRVPADVEVDVFRTDLRIVLRNLVRNAMQALARAPAPRRLALDVAVELEATGEEFVVFHVRDSSPDGLRLGEGSTADVSRGLGIVDTALRRYDGSLQVLPTGDGYAKDVVVRFFHSQRRSLRGEAA
jgi:signal transduction histidine kinase